MLSLQTDSRINNDAILIKIYAACVTDKKSAGIKFSFITHDTSDFSLHNGDNKLPHPDIKSVFSRIKSSYYIKLTEAVQKIRPESVSDLMLEHEWIEEPRSLSDILEAMNELTDKIWYNRHQNWLYRIETGEHRITTKKDVGKYRPSITPREVYNGARKAAREKVKQYGKKNLGPWDDFEWGMLNGKLSTLHLVLGEDWESLYT